MLPIDDVVEDGRDVLDARHPGPDLSLMMKLQNVSFLLCYLTTGGNRIKFKCLITILCPIQNKSYPFFKIRW
jgi:hypothetical protein